MNWSSLQYIVQQLEQDTHRPDCVGTVNDIMYSRYSTLIRQPLLAHIESPLPWYWPTQKVILDPPSADMTMFDQMTSINVADQDEDLASLIKCVNWNKNSIVNISDWEEQKDPLSTTWIVLYF